jgi:Asp-tRNA(Asn)/Glu-tRNA(Gln) amidotransferase C subunit
MIEERTERNDAAEEGDHREIYSKAVRAGKRTYFFDVKATKKNDYFLTITESKKRFHKDGRFFFEKHKIFLYKEDFEKFADGFTEVIEYIKNIKSVDPGDSHDDESMESVTMEDYTAVDFDDLESVDYEEKQRKN